MNSLNFVNGRSQFSQKKYEQIIDSLLIDEVNISLIQECANLLSQINQQNERALIKYALETIHSTIKSQLQIEKVFLINRHLLLESEQWILLKNDILYQKLISQLCGENNTSLKPFEDLNNIQSITIDISIYEMNEIIQLENKELQIQKIITIISKQAELNFLRFLMFQCRVERDINNNDIQVTFDIINNQTSELCDKIQKKLNQPHQIKQTNNSFGYQFTQSVDQMQNGVVPNQVWMNLFSNSARLKQIKQIQAFQGKQNQSISFEQIKQIYSPISDPKLILNEIVETLDLASCILEYFKVLQEYCKSIPEIDNKNEQPLNTIQASCESLIKDYQVKYKLENIKYCDFNNEKEKQDYFQQQQQKYNYVPMKYLYQIDKQGIQMYTDDIQGNQSFYISISFNTKEQLIRGSFGQFLIDDSDMIRIYFVQIESFQKVIQSVMVKNDDLTKQLIKCLMVSATHLFAVFINHPIIFKHLQNYKQLNTNLYLPRDNKQINDLLHNLESKRWK